MAQAAAVRRGLMSDGVVPSAAGFSVEPRFDLRTRQPHSSAATGRKIEQDPQHRKGQGARQSKSGSAGTAQRAGGAATTAPGCCPGSSVGARGPQLLLGSRRGRGRGSASIF